MTASDEQQKRMTTLAQVTIFFWLVGAIALVISKNYALASLYIAIAVMVWLNNKVRETLNNDDKDTP